MKKTYLLSALLSLLVLVSCKKENPQPRETTAQKILGKRKILHINEEFYSPVTVLIDQEEYTGTPGDSVVLKSNNVMYSYTQFGNEQGPYRVVNDSTIIMDSETWKMKLEGTGLQFIQEETDVQANERTVTRITLAR